MSHKEAEELAAEIAWMQDDPSFRPKKDPLLKKPKRGSGYLEFTNYARHYIHDTPTGHKFILVAEDGITYEINCIWPNRIRTKDGRVVKK